MNANYDADPNAARSAPAAPPTPRDQARAKRDYYLDDPRRKSPVLALVLSAMPGLGQIYVGYYQQGFIHALTVAVTIGLLSSGIFHRVEPLLGFFLAFFWLYNIVDAWRRAVYYNNALAGIGSVELPEEFPLPTFRGSLIGGVALIVVGAIALSNTLFKLPLYWLEQWWPIAFIALGAWLVYRQFAAKQTGGE